MDDMGSLCNYLLNISQIIRCLKTFFAGADFKKCCSISGFFTLGEEGNMYLLCYCISLLQEMP